MVSDPSDDEGPPGLIGNDGTDDEEEPTPRVAPSTPKSKMLWQAIPEQAKGWWMKPADDVCTRVHSRSAPSGRPAKVVGARGHSLSAPSDKPEPAPTRSISASGQAPPTSRASSSRQKVKIKKKVILKPGPSRPKDLDPGEFPLPETAWQALEAAATVGGQWQTDASRHQDSLLSDPRARE